MACIITAQGINKIITHEIWDMGNLKQTKGERKKKKEFQIWLWKPRESYLLLRNKWHCCSLCVLWIVIGEAGGSVCVRQTICLSQGCESTE